MHTNTSLRNLLLGIGTIALLGGAIFAFQHFPPSSTAQPRSGDISATESARQTPGPAPLDSTTPKPLHAPLNKATERVTKKPFGIHISPTHSPVSPEKFSGIHTGTDFEIFPDEAEADVPVVTICAGPLLRKQQARGYGGMVVQACTLNGDSITVVYGHVKLASVNWIVGNNLDQGATLGILGKAYSTETDGERKHLHLGIHTGPLVVTNGYIANQADLHNWLNVMEYID